MMARIMTRPAWLGDLRQDIRWSRRMLVRNAGASAAAILILACGTGLSVAIFSVADVVLRQPLPIVDEARVVALWGDAAGSRRTMPLTNRHFERYRHEARAFVGLAGTVGLDSWPQAIRERDRTFRASVSPVTGNFFSVLGAGAVLGRTLRENDDRAGAAPVAVLSYETWRGLFASTPMVLGRRFSLANGNVFTIVGVAPTGLDYPTGTDIWIPFSAFAVPEVTPIGRLRRGVTPQEAAMELRASFRRDGSPDWKDLGATATPLRRVIVGDVGSVLGIITAAAALVFVTACLNVSNLLLLRSTSRRHEVGVRQALGASRWRIVRQLMVEHVPLGLGAAILGVWLANELVELFVAFAPGDVPRLDDIRIHGASAWLAIVVSGAAALVAGLLPTVWLSSDAGISLRAANRSTTSGRRTVLAQRTFVILQVSGAVVVLFAAGLLGRSLARLQAIEPGFATERLAAIELSWPDDQFRTPSQVAALYERLLLTIGAVPGVVSAAAVNVGPFTAATGGWDGRFVAEGSPATPVFSMAVVSARYFQTLGITLRSGRVFQDADRAGSPLVAIVSERVARLLWPGENAIGKRLRFPEAGSEWRTVIGVAPETRYRALREAAPTVYLPTAQFTEVLPLMRTVAVRTQGAPGPTLASIRQAVQQTDPAVTVLDAAEVSSFVDRQLATPRLGAALVAVFGAGVLLLAAAGLYALLASMVRSRRRELAIRHVVGATPGQLRAIVLGQSLALSGLGLAIGLAASLAASRYFESVLYGVAATDGLTMVAVIVVLGGVAALASYLPARRATQADTFGLLRQE